MRIPRLIREFKYLVLAGLVLSAAVVGLIAWHQGWIHGLLAAKEPILEWCRQHPYALFLALAILPAFAFPASPLLILAGAVWGPNAGACGLAVSAILLNVLLSHLAAAGPGHKLIAGILGERYSRWSQSARASQWQLATMLRITPGVPLCVQNYILGLLRIPLLASLALALPITGSYVCGFVLTGGAIFEGKVGAIILGISILLVVTLLMKMVHSKLKSRNPGTATSP